MANIEQLKANLKQIELSQLANDETKAQALKELEELQAEELLKQTFKDLAKQKEIREQEQKAKDAMTPEDQQKELQRLSLLEDIRLAETLLSVAELELQQMNEDYQKAFKSQETKVLKLQKNLKIISELYN